MRLTITRRTKELGKEINARTGYYVADGSAKLMQLVMPSKLEGVSDDEK